MNTDLEKELKEEITRLSAECAKLEKTCEDLEYQLDSSDSTICELQAEIDDLYKVNNNLEDEISGLKAELEETNSDLSFTKNTVDSIKDTLLAEFLDAIFNKNQYEHLYNNKYLVQDGEIGDYEKSGKELFNDARYLFLYTVLADSLYDLYVEHFGEIENHQINQQKQQGLISAQYYIQDLLNSPMPYKRKLAGGK